MSAFPALPRLFLLEEEYRRAVLQAELDWLRGVIADLRERCHGEEVRDDEDANAPAERDPDVGADRLLGQQGADRVDDTIITTTIMPIAFIVVP